MAKTVSTIDRLLKEHRELQESFNSCQITLSDVMMRDKVETAQGIFNPGRLEDHRQKALQLERELMAVEDNLRTHFRCEEQDLLEDFRQRKIDRLVSILGELIVEHEDILKMVGELRRDVATLATSQASVSAWQDKAWQVRPRLVQLAEQIQSHARQEETLYEEAKATMAK